VYRLKLRWYTFVCLFQMNNMKSKIVFKNILKKQFRNKKKASWKFNLFFCGKQVSVWKSWKRCIPILHLITTYWLDTFFDGQVLIVMTQVIANFEKMWQQNQLNKIHFLRNMHTVKHCTFWHGSDVINMYHTCILGLRNQKGIKVKLTIHKAQKQATWIFLTLLKAHTHTHRKTMYVQIFCHSHMHWATSFYRLVNHLMEQLLYKFHVYI